MDLKAVLILFGVALLLLILSVMTKTLEALKDLYSKYSPIEKLLTPTELKFWRVLRRVVPDELIIFSKVRLCDIAQVKDRNDIKAFHRISSKHVDFVLCREDDTAFVCVIELDDLSHLLPDRQKRDDFVDGVMKRCKLPILHIKTAKIYDETELERRIADAIAGQGVK
ncbi:MAG: DUF2726 domain-containing protein [Opitutales bacterium]|nr:DUF2726 domain-containing protein [Opitutales bacterium]